QIQNVHFLPPYKVQQQIERTVKGVDLDAVIHNRPAAPSLEFASRDGEAARRKAGKRSPALSLSSTTSTPIDRNAGSADPESVANFNDASGALFCGHFLNDERLDPGSACGLESIQIQSSRP